MTYVGCARIQAVLREEAQQMRIVVAPQEFKGTLSSREAAEAMGEGARRAVPDATIELAPRADGGPGLVEVVLATAGGRLLRTPVEDPLGRTIEARWLRREDRRAVIESAAA